MDTKISSTIEKDQQFLYITVFLKSRFIELAEQVSCSWNDSQHISELGFSASLLFTDCLKRHISSLTAHHSIKDILQELPKTEVTGTFLWGQDDKGDTGTTKHKIYKKVCAYERMKRHRGSIYWKVPSFKVQRTCMYILKKTPPQTLYITVMFSNVLWTFILFFYKWKLE